MNIFTAGSGIQDFCRNNDFSLAKHAYIKPEFAATDSILKISVQGPLYIEYIIQFEHNYYLVILHMVMFPVRFKKHSRLNLYFKDHRYYMLIRIEMKTMFNYQTSIEI